MAEKRNLNLDLLRIIASIAVIGLHSFCKFYSLTNAVLYHLCSFSLPIFFVITGFLIIRKDKEITLKYCFKKTVSILRLLLIWNVIGFLIFLPFYDFVNEYSLSDVPRLFVLQFFKTFIQAGSLWHMWFLGAQVIVYYLCFIFVKLKKKNEKITSVLWAIFMAGSFVIQILCYFGVLPSIYDIYQICRLWTWIQYLLLGSMLINLQEKTNKLPVKLHAVLLFCLTVFVVGFQIYIGSKTNSLFAANKFYDDPLLVLLCVVIFTFVLRLKLSPKVMKVCSSLGGASLITYIVHPIILRVVEVVVEINSVSTSIIVYLFVVIYSLVMAFVIYKIPFGKYFYKL